MIPYSILGCLLSILALSGPARPVPGAAPSPQDAPAFEAAALADLRVEGEREVLAVALDLARRGRPEAALERLRPVAEGSEELEPWLERLEEFGAARGKLIDKVLGKTSLRLLEDGVQLELEVTGRAGDVLQIAASPDHGLRELPLERVDAATLALNARRSSTSFGPKWLPGFALWLAGDESFSEALDRTGRKLRDELEGERELLSLGRGLGALLQAREAAGGAMPEFEAALEDLIAANSDFVGAGGAAMLRPAYAGVGRELLAVLGPSRGFDALLDAEVELLDEGRLRLVYDFKAGRQPFDFAATDDWFELGGGYPAAGLPASDAPRLVPERGLQFTGSHTLKHRLLFTDDVRVELELTYGELPDGEPLGVVLAGACVRPGRAWAVAWNFMLLQAIDADRELSLSADADGLSAFAGKAYTYALELAGGALSMSTRGKQRAALEVGPFKPGEVLFGARCRHPILFERVALEGRPFVEDMGLLQRSWVERQSARWFSSE